MPQRLNRNVERGGRGRSFHLKRASDIADFTPTAPPFLSRPQSSNVDATSPIKEPDKHMELSRVT